MGGAPTDAAGMPQAEWAEVVSSLEELLPAYERLNRAITFGLADRWRRRAARLAKPEEIVLEIGSGPGTFAALLRSRRVILIDPSERMLEASRHALPSDRYEFRLGRAEALPLEAGSVDRAFCSFAFRDFPDKARALGELHRVLRPGGELHILEVAKVGGGLRGPLMDLYIRWGVPALAWFLVSPRTRRSWRTNPYRSFAQTYQAFGVPAFYEDLLRGAGFVDVRSERLELGGAVLLSGVKPHGA